MNFYLAIKGAKETTKQRGARLRKERILEAKEKATHTKEEWESLVVEFSGSCVSCGSVENIQKDHITPIYQGGSDGLENIQPLCRRCNASKGSDSFNWVVYRRANPFGSEAMA